MPITSRSIFPRPIQKNLRSLQADDELNKLLTAITTERKRLVDENEGKYVPIALKIAPDLENDDILRISDQLVSFGIDAIIATQHRQFLVMLFPGMPNCNETGGLSGKPLRARSTEVCSPFVSTLAGNDADYCPAAA